MTTAAEDKLHSMLVDVVRMARLTMLDTISDVLDEGVEKLKAESEKLTEDIDENDFEARLEVARLEGAALAFQSITKSMMKVAETA